MAHTKSSGSVKTNKDSISKRRGVKMFGGEKVIPGNIIVRQKGTKFFPGDGTSMGKDFTIFATVKGAVAFKKKLGKQLVEVV
ncbi:MAG: 50S ribosomal protein L27 [Candidatus Levyibacteriota bacterium]